MISLFPLVLIGRRALGQTVNKTTRLLTMSVLRFSLTVTTFLVPAFLCAAHLRAAGEKNRAELIKKRIKNV